MIEHGAGDTVEEIYLTVKELAELKGCTERYIQSQIRKGQIVAEQATGSVIGRGGIQYRIPLSGLERRIQTKFKRRLRAIENALQPEQMIEEVDAESLTQEEREEIIFWKRTLEDWQRYRDCASSKERADEAYIELFAVQHPEMRLTRRTLYRKWRDWQKKGEAALADRRGKHESHQKKLDGEIYDVFEYYYLDQSRKSVTLCMTLTELNFRQSGREDLLPLPSKTTFERAVRSIPIPYVKYFRYGEKQFIGECAPYIRRMYEDLESNDIWVADNHTFDIMVAKDGSPVRVYLTAFMDVRSRKMMGWCVTDAPSSDATIYALKKGCEEYGVPKALYTDNGREFLFHDLGGNGFRKKRKNEELKLPSILDDLGIAFRTALPRNARAKGIERAFYTVKETFSKLYTLNLRDVRIYDTKTDPDGKERRVLNSKETTLAQQKQQAIKDAFAEWIWKDPDRRQELVTKYNELFNSNRPREYDGRHISFSGMNPEIHLREHQLNAVAHILYGGNTLLAHEVGAGKTFEMVAAAMESKRLGLCHKPMFVVPNHLTEQWASEFLRLYPSANILAATKKDFEPKNRKKFCARIATSDYDAIIIGHSQFERIPVSMERQERLLREQIDEVTEGIEELKSSRAERFTIKSMERTKKGLETKLKKLLESGRKDDVVTFEELGVDRLYVDEAHAFKNRAKRCATSSS